MLLGIPVGEIAWLALWIVAAGAVTGVLAGLFGIGGGAIIVPVLYELFRVLGVPDDVRMQLCVGTSIAIIVPTTIRSYYAHKARGAVIAEVVRLWTVPAIVGVAVGAATATFAPGAVFKIAFVLFALFISIRLLLGGNRWNLGTDLPGNGLMRVYGFITGLCSSLVGIGAGAVSNAVLTMYGRPMPQVVATATGIGVPITIAGTVGYMLAGWPHMAQMPPLSIGFVSLLGFALMAPVSSFTSSYGVRLAHWMPKRKLEIGFGIFMMLASVRFIVSLI
ncbi:MAG: sulfite exporter TauE/SafE family protein [Pseudolabrys sp.]|nr:sulfite exporter TauE/SafE family protein [Pseudolabrys sp.]